MPVPAPSVLPFPNGPLDQPDQVLALLGSFWSRTYAGQAQLRAYADGQARRTRAALDALGTAADCLAATTVPVARRLAWQPLRVRRSTLGTTGAVPRFGDGTVFGEEGRAYGQAVAGAAVVVPLPPDLALVDVPVIVNRLTDPSLVLCQGIDYRLDAAHARLLFAADPFADDRWPTEPIFDGPVVVDQELVLWLYRPAVDRQDIWTQFGAVLGLHLASSDHYRRLVAATIAALVQGPSAATIAAVVAAATGIALAAGTETVEAAGTDDAGLLVVTDQAVYRYPAEARSLVAPGQTVTAGQPLCDAVQIDSLHRGVVPAGLTALAIGPGLLGPGFQSDLVFRDQTVPLDVTVDPQGRRRVAWALSGLPADVQRFWDRVHAQGIASGTLLADRLQTAGPAEADRAAADPTRDRVYLAPAATGLPGGINPLRFLVQNLLRTALVIRIRAGALPPGAPGLSGLHGLRRLLAPYTVVLLVVELPALGDSAIMDDTPDAPGTYRATDPLTDTLVAAAAWDGPLEGRLVRRAGL